MAITDNDLRTTKYLLKQGGGLVTNKNVADDILNDFRRLVLAVNAVVGGGDLAITMGLGRDVDATGTINTSASALAIDVNGNKLHDALGLAVWWGARALMYADGTTASLEWRNAYLYDQLGNQSGDWNQRILYEDNGSTRSVDWGDRSLFNNSDIKTVDWDNSILNAIYASTPKTSIDWNNRVLYSITGSFIFPSVDYNNFELKVPDGTVTVDWGSGRLRDLGNIITIDWNTQRLFNAPFGSETLNWSTNTLTGSWKSTVAFGIGVPSAFTGSLEFSNATNSNVVIVRAGTTSPSSYVLTLPTAVASAGQVLTDVAGDGVLSWTTVAGGGGGDLAATLALGNTVATGAAGYINAFGGNLAISINDRWLVDTVGNVMIDWQTKTLNDAAEISVNWGNRTLVEETNGDVTLNWDTRKTYDSQGTPKQSIDWNGRVLSDLTEVPAINWGTRVASDSTGTISIDWSNTKRQLYDFSGVLSVYWGNRAMYDTTGTVISIHYGDRILRDHLSDVSMTWGTSRRLRAAAAAVIAGSGDVLDWTSCWLKDLSNVEALNWNAKSITGTWKYLDGNQAASKVLTSDASGNMSWQAASGGEDLAATLALGNTVATGAAGYINAFGGNLAISINDRELYDSTGLDVRINWETRKLFGTGGDTIVDWNILQLSDNGVTVVLDWNTKRMWDGSGALSVDWGNRLLKSSTVTTLDYENILTQDYADDTAAGVGGIVVGQMYHNAGAMRIRLT